MTNAKEADKILALAKTLGFLRVKDLLSRGTHPEHLRRLCNKSLLVRTGRGLYRLTDVDACENITLAAVVKRIPNGAICLLSALRFHRIGTQNPPAVWVALKQRAAYPRGKKTSRSGLFDFRLPLTNVGLKPTCLTACLSG